MAMKETERSLRWFFLIAGGLAAFQALFAMSELVKLPRVVPIKLIAPFWYGTISHFVLGALFFLAGLRLKEALLTGARWIQHLVLIAGVALVVEVIWILAAFGIQAADAYQEGMMAGGFIGLGIRLAIVAYLYASVRRLSAEAQVRTAGTTFE